MAMILVSVHWLLTLFWGLALNNHSGFLYCRLVIPDAFDLERGDVLHGFSLVGIAVLFGFGIVDRKWLRLSSRLAFYPLPLFVVTQLLLAWVNLSSARY